ncbi:MAG: ABC transporter ATP-binding protein [Acidimicrobiia bacterium]
MSIEPIVAASNLTKSYAPQAGVFDIDLEVSGRQIVGLIGPSGSGKTTTVRLMTGLLAPDSGSVRVLGQDPTRFTAQMRARIGYMPQDSVFYPDLTLRENLNFAASLYGMPYRRKRQIEEVIDFVDLGPAMNRLLRDASGGEKRRLSLAATLIHKPDLTFLDEPTAGVDPILRRKFWDHFEHLSESESTLLITTQYVGEAAYCDYVGVLAAGRLIAFETPDGLRRRAFGGELLDIVFSRAPDHDDVARLSGRSDVRKVAWLDDRVIRLSVDDVGEVTPSVVEWARLREVEIEKVEPYLPPFDDVFVELVANLDHDDGQPEVEAAANAN